MSREETVTTQQDALNEEFHPNQIKEVQGFDYVSVGDVIRRLNDVLGTGGWSSQIVMQQYFEERREVVAQVMITATVDGLHCTADGFGGAGNNPRGLGDQYKSAASDALKKAAQRLGVGLHLAVDELVEPEPERTSNIEREDWDKVMGALKDVSADQKEEAKGWWGEYGGTELNFYEVEAEAWGEFKAYIRTFWEAGEQEAMSPEDVAAELGGEIVE